MKRKTSDPFAKRAGGFKGFGTGEFGKKPKRTQFAAAEVRAPDLEDTEFEYLLRKLKTPALAKRIKKLKSSYPDGTVPELVTLDWLNAQQVQHIYQLEYGARNQMGSARPDFVLPNRGLGMVWEINGEYWHTKRKTPQSDAARRARLLNSIIGGVRISKVVALWEGDIYRNYPRIFELALSGVGMRD
jgi:hypothetical protein